MRSIFITGSGRRIGRGLALEFARKGWDVVLHYNNSEESAFNTLNEILSFGVRSIAVKANVLSYDEVNSAFDKIINEFKLPNVLINNAGIYPPRTPLNELSQEKWDNVLGINLRGEFFFSQIFAKHTHKGARIINIASLGGFEVWKQRIHYHVSKAGVIHLTRCLAQELAPNISVNCVCPGTIVIPDEPSNDPLIQLNRIPMGRYGSIKDVFDAVYFFATCTSFITGQVISVDGGYHDAR